jgi:hypothetical protein
MFFIWWSLMYGVWTFMILFCPIYFLSDFDFLEVCGHIAYDHVPLSILHFLTSLWFLTSWRSKLMTFDPLWLERSFINWLSTHWPFSLMIHLRSILILTSLVWWQMASMKQWSMKFVLFWICIQIGWYYMWMFIISSIPYHEQPFFQELQFSISTLNYFFVFVQRFYACPSSCYFSQVFWYMDSQSFCPSLVHDKGDLLGGPLFVLPHFCVLRLTTTTHPTCVSFIHNDMHIVGPISNMILICGACNIRTFHSLNEICSLVSIGIRPIHITSNKLSYTQHMFSFSRCTNGFYAICGILCCKGVLKGF